MLKEQLRKASKAAGKTQKEVAAFLGVTESTYCGYETGKRHPDAIKLNKISKFLGVSGDVLLDTGIDQGNGPVRCPNGIHVIQIRKSVIALIQIGKICTLTG